MSEGDNPKRSLEEVLTFRGIECAVLIMRIFVMIYFFREAYKHSRLTKNKDMYSIATFVLLSLSIIMFFLNSFSEFAEQTLRALYDQDTLMVSLFEIHATLIRIIRTVFRILIGYLCQNLAFLVNIERWQVILQEGNKRAFKASIYALILNALFLSTLSMAKWRYFDWLMVLA
jgi:hypothetical protein